MLEFRDRIKSFYSENSTLIRIFLRFVCALVVYMGINHLIGYSGYLNNIIVLIVLALISAILPWNATVVIGIILIIVHCFALGTEVGIFAAALYIVMAVFYFRLCPNDSFALLLTPVAALFHVEALIPVSLGLLRSPVSAVAAAFSVISWRFLYSVSQVVSVFKQDPNNTFMTVLQKMLSELVENKALMVSLIAFVFVTLVVWAIRKLHTTYSWQIAIAAGSVLYIVAGMCGEVLMGVKVDIVLLLIGTAAAAGLAFVLEFFVYSVDYASTRYLEFQDDEYYYYIKAVPKRKSDYAKQREAEEDEEELYEEYYDEDE